MEHFFEFIIKAGKRPITKVLAAVVVTCLFTLPIIFGIPQARERITAYVLAGVSSGAVASLILCYKDARAEKHRRTGRLGKALTERVMGCAVVCGMAIGLFSLTCWAIMLMIRGRNWLALFWQQPLAMKRSCGPVLLIPAGVSLLLHAGIRIVGAQGRFRGSEELPLPNNGKGSSAPAWVRPVELAYIVFNFPAILIGTMASGRNATSLGFVAILTTVLYTAALWFILQCKT